MGHICYSCKKELKWHMIKFTYDEIVKSTSVSESFGMSNAQQPPVGFTLEDRLCRGCLSKCPKIDSVDAKKIRQQEEYLQEGITSQQCSWCQKEVKINQIMLVDYWIQRENIDHCQCNDCGEIITSLTSTKLQELFILRDNENEKISLLTAQFGDADKSVTSAKYRKYVGMLSGEGDIIPGYFQQDLENSSKQHKGTLELKLLNATQELTRISNLILSEQTILAKKYFFNMDSNEPEKKVNSTNTIKTNEYDVPVEILKNRLAKGEITVEELNKIPPSFFHASGLSTSPLEILKRRYASGEITLEEFNKIKENLDKM
jgi:uncharacterized membrane protein